MSLKSSVAICGGDPWPELRDRLNNEGAVVVASTPEHFGAFLRAETEKAARIVKASGMTATN